MRKEIYAVVIIGALTVLLPLHCKAQVKYERERKVSVSEIPESAVLWFKHAYPDAKKVKWYAEETSGKKSFEAKLRFNSTMHSVEFNTEGEIEDIEIVKTWNELPDTTRRELEHYFKTQYKRFTIKKIQEQWTGNADFIMAAIRDGEKAGITTRYEIEYYAVDDAQKALWEGLFKSDGQFIEKREVILRPTDNLNY